jgi:ferredoxin like protein
VARVEELRMTPERFDPDFEDRMATVDFDVSPRPHITLDTTVCDGCSTRSCVSVCPAKLFVELSDGGILFNYEQCFECGSCYLVCNEEGALHWSYPDGGRGVALRRG